MTCLWNMNVFIILFIRWNKKNGKMLQLYFYPSIIPESVKRFQLKNVSQAAGASLFYAVFDEIQNWASTVTSKLNRETREKKRIQMKIVSFCLCDRRSNEKKINLVIKWKYWQKGLDTRAGAEIQLSENVCRSSWQIHEDNKLNNICWSVLGNTSVCLLTLYVFVCTHSLRLSLIFSDFCCWWWESFASQDKRR